ncbi:hypothetical protein PF011_g13712 [Phytophthora fragariae]|uniref:Uncharacterized protein n=1 Tax=Phytophthora fragariae TaxID=53985 RepID=A0A6A3K7G7_9STRA|nr:hypothetical protein PF011_g13712 [Phytophthora fragariae]
MAVEASRVEIATLDVTIQQVAAALSVTVNDKKSVTRVQFVAWLVPKPPEKYGALHPTQEAREPQHHGARVKAVKLEVPPSSQVLVQSCEFRYPIGGQLGVDSTEVRLLALGIDGLEERDEIVGETEGYQHLSSAGVDEELAISSKGGVNQFLSPRHTRIEDFVFLAERDESGVHKPGSSSTRFTAGFTLTVFNSFSRRASLVP